MITTFKEFQDKWGPLMSRMDADPEADKVYADACSVMDALEAQIIPHDFNVGDRVKPELWDHPTTVEAVIPLVRYKIAGSEDEWYFHELKLATEPPSAEEFAFALRAYQSGKPEPATEVLAKYDRWKESQENA